MGTCNFLCVPSDMTFAVGLSYVLCLPYRAGDWVKLQQVALKLMKQFPKSADVFVWWVVDAILLQARAAAKQATTAESGSASQTSTAAAGAAGPGLGAGKLLQLAEGMMLRQMNKSGASPPGREVLMTYLGVLQAQVGEGQAMTSTLRDASKHGMLRRGGGGCMFVQKRKAVKDR